MRAFPIFVLQYEFHFFVCQVVQEALERACSGRTCIVIAHHLSSIQNSDQILVMNDGAITEFGTHQELLQREGLYANLIKMQNLQ